MQRTRAVRPQNQIGKLALIFFSTCLVKFCPSIRAQGTANQPQYYVSPQYYAHAGYLAVTEGRQLVKVQRERAWNGSSWNYTGNIQRLRTTGAFSAPDAEVVTTNTAPIPFGYDHVLSEFYGGVRMPNTSNGETLLYMGTIPAGQPSPTESGGVIWNAHDSMVRLASPPILSVSLLTPRDMNESLQMVGYATKEYTSEGETRQINIPVIGASSGTVGIIQPGLGNGYGFAYGMTTNGTQMVTNNGARAVAINNQGVLVCDAHYMKKDEQGYYKYLAYSFTSKNGVPLNSDLPSGATDINDLGEIVGYNATLHSWLYLPSTNYGLSFGIHTIDATEYNPDNYQSLRVRINDRGDITWTGVDTTVVGSQDLPPKLWHAGQLYTLTDLYSTSDQFTLKDVIDMNSNGDLLVSMLFNKDFSGTTYEVSGNRILSLTPFVETPEAPSMAISLSNGQMTISWPTPSSAWTLQQISNLTNAGGWSPSDYAVSSNNGVSSIVIPTATGKLFFRLTQP